MQRRTLLKAAALVAEPVKRRTFLKAAALIAALPVPEVFTKTCQGRIPGGRMVDSSLAPGKTETALPVDCRRKNKYGCQGCFDWTEEKITEAADTWFMFNGFSAETCSDCKRKVNVPAGGPGWFCCCGGYNCQSFSGYQMPYEKPDLGPTQATIRRGIHRSRGAIKQRQWQREFDRKYGKPSRGRRSAEVKLQFLP